MDFFYYFCCLIDFCFGYFSSCINLRVSQAANSDSRRPGNETRTGANDDSILIAPNCVGCQTSLMSHNFLRNRSQSHVDGKSMKFPMKTAFQPSVLPTVEPCLHPSRTDREGIINGRRCYGRYRAVKKSRQTSPSRKH